MHAYNFRFFSVFLTNCFLKKEKTERVAGDEANEQRRKHRDYCRCSGSQKSQNDDSVDVTLCWVLTIGEGRDCLWSRHKKKVSA